MTASLRKSNPIERPIFMIGAPRSGTTLIADIVSFHEDLGWFSNYCARYHRYPQAAALSRLVDIPLVGNLLRGKEASGGKNRWKSRLPYPREAYSIWDHYCRPGFSIEYLFNLRPTPKEKDDIRSFIHKVLRYQGKKRFFNKMTGPARIGYLSEIFPDACFIHIIRDPRAVVSSLLNVHFWINYGGYDSPWWKNGLVDDYARMWKASGENPSVLAAVQWRQIIEHARCEVEALADSSITYMEVKYEDFTAHPETGLEEILKSAGLSPSRRVEFNLKNRTTLKDMNFKFKKNLSPADIAAIEAATRPTAADLGYLQ